MDYIYPQSGDVDGPSSSTNGGIAYFSGTSGKLLESSAIYIDGSGINLDGLSITNGDEITATFLHATSAVDADTMQANDITVNNSITTGSINFGGDSLSAYTINAFTPTVTLGGAGNVPEYVINIGQFIQIGSAYFVTVMLQSDGGTEGSGASQISIDLPAASNASAAGPLGIVGWYKNGATVNSLSGYSVGTTTKISLYKGAGTDSPLTGADQNNTTREIILHFWYWS